MTMIHIPSQPGRTCPTCGASSRRIMLLFGFQVCDVCLAAARHYLGVRAKAYQNRLREVTR